MDNILVSVNLNHILDIEVAKEGLDLDSLNIDGIPDTDYDDNDGVPDAEDIDDDNDGIPNDEGDYDEDYLDDREYPILNDRLPTTVALETDGTVLQ